jgi:anti-anti-sigma regulatory factor
VTWRETAQLRERLFDEFEASGSTGVRLDVRRVQNIDQTGVALLIGANHRATAAGRRLVLIDANGPVTAALARMHMIPDFVITQVISAD